MKNSTNSTSYQPFNHSTYYMIFNNNTENPWNSNIISNFSNPFPLLIWQISNLDIGGSMPESPPLHPNHVLWLADLKHCDRIDIWGWVRAVIPHKINSAVEVFFFFFSINNITLFFILPLNFFPIINDCSQSKAPFSIRINCDAVESPKHERSLIKDCYNSSFCQNYDLSFHIGVAKRLSSLYDHNKV